jgi:DNA-binding XRE family transcriptional regulator
MRRKGKTSRNVVIRPKRIVKTIMVKTTIVQVERPYVLFGEAVKKAREDIGMTQDVLASKLNKTRTTIVNIENGRQRVLLADLIKFAKALRIPPSFLLGAITE